MPARLLEAHPRAERCQNQVVIARGPVLYCLKSADIPKGVELDDVLVPTGVEFAPVDAEMEFEIMARAGGALHRGMYASPLAEVPVRLISYFAWVNSWYCAMSVWIPVAWRWAGSRESASAGCSTLVSRRRIVMTGGATTSYRGRAMATWWSLRAPVVFTCPGSRSAISWRL